MKHRVVHSIQSRLLSRCYFRCNAFKCSLCIHWTFLSSLLFSDFVTLHPIVILCEAIDGYWQALTNMCSSGHPPM